LNTKRIQSNTCYGFKVFGLLRMVSNVVVEVLIAKSIVPKRFVGLENIVS